MSSDQDSGLNLQDEVTKNIHFGAQHLDTSTGFPVGGGANISPSAYGPDIAAVDIATRIAIVQFLNSSNVIGNLTEHIRTLRLYPRPVIAFQVYSFLKSRPMRSQFIDRFAKTQVINQSINPFVISRRLPNHLRQQSLGSFIRLYSSLECLSFMLKALIFVQKNWIEIITKTSENSTFPFFRQWNFSPNGHSARQTWPSCVPTPGLRTLVSSGTNWNGSPTNCSPCSTKCMNPIPPSGKLLHVPFPRRSSFIIQDICPPVGIFFTVFLAGFSRFFSIFLKTIRSCVWLFDSSDRRDSDQESDADVDYHPSAAIHDMDYARADFCYEKGKLTGFAVFTILNFWGTAVISFLCIQT